MFSDKRHLALALLFVVAMLFSFENSSAQKISGTITEGKSGEPLIGAVVSLKGSQQAVATDANGKFELTTDAKPPLVLVISYVGFEQQEFTVKSFEKAVNIKLKEKEFTLR